jgi:hypothetical protein
MLHETPAEETTMTDQTADGARTPQLFAEVVRADALYYTTMFAEKPFEPALLLFCANGAYRILSPGEDHPGSYVAEGPLDAERVRVNFISWPSEDWNRNVAFHVLDFDRTSGRFTQQLRLPGDREPKHQAGRHTEVTTLGHWNAATTWESAAPRLASVFAALAAG